MSLTTETPQLFGAAKEELTQDEIVQRAKDMRELLRQEASEGERLGRYTEKVHDAFLEAGLYHLLTPKRYNGYEFDVKTYIRTAMALAEGDPGAAWNWALGHSHALEAAAFWPEEVQEKEFNNPRGYFKAGHSLRPAGTATPVKGGYHVKGRSDYQSGISYGSHATVYVQLTSADGQPPTFVDVLLSEGQYEVLDNWGTDKVMGLAASGSNSVVFDTVVEELYVRRLDDHGDPANEHATPGLKLHGNPQYLATPIAFQGLGLHCIPVGAARAAAEEYERLAYIKNSTYVPMPPRTQDAVYQRDFYTALSKADAAEYLILRVADEYMDRVAAQVNDGVEFSLRDSAQLAGSAFEAGHLAADAIDIVFQTAGSGEVTGKGKLIEKLHRDLWTYRCHGYGSRGGFSRDMGSMMLGSAGSYHK